MAKNVKGILDSKMISNAFSDLDGWGKVGLAFDVSMGYKQYKESLEKGDSKLTAGAKAVGEGVLSNMLGMKYLGLQAAIATPKLAVDATMAIQQNTRKMNRQGRNVPFQNATFVDSQQAYTMRQTGMQLAQASKYNLQHAMLGNEASYLHL